MNETDWTAERERRAAVNAEGALRRRERWAAFVAAHGLGVRRWSGPVFARFEHAAERVMDACHGWRRRPSPAPRDPWVRVGIWRELEPEDFAPTPEPRAPRWLDHHRPPRWPR